MTVNTSDNRYGVAQLIVAPTIAEGANYTSIASALTAAVSGQTIFIRPGTYTENPILKAGVNLTAFPSDGYGPNVIILGKCGASFVGTCAIAGIQLKTNSDFAVAVTGSSATVVQLVDCFVDCNNNTGLSLSSSSGSSKLQLFNCKMDIDTTGIAHFANSGSGAIKFFNCDLENNGSSVTASTSSGAGGINFYSCFCQNAITTSSTSSFTMHDTDLEAVLTTNGTGTNIVSNCYITGGSSSAVSVGTGATLSLTQTSINSSNTNAITGAGTLNYSGLSFTGTSVKINTTTQAGGTLQGGVTQAPSAGFLGEQIRSNVPNTSPTSISNNTPTSIVNIQLTAGIWDVSAMGGFSGATTATLARSAISANNNSYTGTVGGDSNAQSPTTGFSTSDLTLAIPSFRVTLTATTTYYLVNQLNYTVGSGVSYGRISATRVG